MSSLQNINECPDCYSILTQCIIENIHIKDLIMLCNKSDCDCYSNTNNPHYAMIPTCNICQFVYYNTRLQEHINNTFHCSNKHCNKTYFTNDTSNLILLIDDDFEKYLIKKYT